MLFFTFDVTLFRFVEFPLGTGDGESTSLHKVLQSTIAYLDGSHLQYVKYLVSGYIIDCNIRVYS